MWALSVGVEIGEWLVEQKHLGIAHDGAAHGDTLALAARKFARASVKEVPDAKPDRRTTDLFADCRLGGFAHRQAEAHIGGDVHMRIQRVGLEYHGDIAILRRDIVDEAPPDHDLAGRRLLEPGDDAQQR